AGAFAAALAGWESADQQPRKEALAVLDFTNLSGDAALEWLSSGIAETLTVDLKRAGRLKLVDRAAVAGAQCALGEAVRSDEAALALARRVGARWVVWGTFQSDSGQLRFNPRVGDASRG